MNFVGRPFPGMPRANWLTTAMPSLRMLRTTRITATKGLLSSSFLGLLATQFLTGLNDNLFRWLAIGLGHAMTGGASAFVLVLGTVCFVLPYIVLAAPAGYLADRFSKRDVIFGCKLAELVILVLGSVAVLSGSFTLMMVTTALLGAQSALFAPSRLGIIPELLRRSAVPARERSIRPRDGCFQYCRHGVGELSRRPDHARAGVGRSGGRSVD